MKGFRDCHLRDGTAIIRYLAWLENELVTQNKADINEFSASCKLSEFRKQEKLFMGESFETISSSGK